MKPRSRSGHRNNENIALKSHHGGERDVQEIVVFHQELHHVTSTSEI